ncbi:MAG: beta-ketoadipate enol-lactone hydrolase [Acidimicrobiales bacterium]|nr:beta-ketoadipate enol-lactone hydrolase [Acidimicrobiales bacterium]
MLTTTATGAPDRQIYIDSLSVAARASGFAFTEVVLPERRSVLAGDHRLNVVDWGGAGKPVVVLLHGAGLTSRTWDLTCLSLRDRYHCIAVDLRGHGDSEWSVTGDYSTTAIGADIAALLQTLDAAPILVGHSLGGMGAVRCAIDHDVQLSGLVVVDIGPSTVRHGRGARSGPAQLPSDPVFYDTFDEFVDDALTINPRRERRQLEVSLTHNARRLADGRWTWKYDQRYFGRNSRRPPSDEFTRNWVGLEQLTVPFLAIRGEHSRFLDRSGAAELATIAGGTWVEIPGAGHTVHGDNPKAFATAVASFLDELATAGPDMTHHLEDQ